MAAVYITEFSNQALDSQNRLMTVPKEPALANQKVTIGASSAQSSAFTPETTLIRIHTDAICSIEIGTNPTAANTKRRMAANSTEYVGVPAGKGYKVAVITNT